MKMEQEEEIEEKKGKGNVSVSITDPKTKYVSTYSMSTRIKKNLDQKIIPDLNKRDKDAFLIIDGGEGCFFKDILIKTSDGDKRIEDLYNHKQFFVESLNLETNKTEQGKAICVKTGTQELFEIETEDGRKVKATKNHTFFVLREGKVYEVKLSDLKIGYCLVGKQNTLIKSISPVGFGETYDIKVQPIHNYFLSNGLLSHNCGKSTLAFQIGKYIDPSLDLSRIVFSPDDFREAVLKAKKGQVIVYDEAFTGFSSRSSLSPINRVLVSLSMQMRQKNLCIIIVLPTIFLLDKYVAMFRAKALIHVFESHGKRGYFKVYNARKKKLLILLGAKTMSYKHKGLNTHFKGRFYGKFALGDADCEKKYRKMKEKALSDSEKTSMSSAQVRFKEQRDLLVWLFRIYTKLKYQQMEKILEEYNFNMSFQQIGKICAKYGELATDKEEKDKEDNKNIEKKEEIELEDEENLDLDINEEYSDDI